MPDRDIYPVKDVDVWLINCKALDLFYSKLTHSLSQEYRVREKGFDNFHINLRLRPTLFFGHAEDGQGNHLPQGRVDLSAPLLKDNPEYLILKIQDKNTTIRIEEKFLTTIAQAQPLPMYIQNEEIGYPQT